MNAIQRLRQNASRGGLAHSTGPGKNVGVRDAPGFNGILQRSRDVLLPDNF
jgi:hypothetical protein